MSRNHNRLFDYFTLIADKIDVDSKVAGLSTNSSDKGTIRERLVELFLAKHLPRRLRPFLGGTVFGVQGNESKQIDVLVSSDIAVNFEEHEKMFVAVENVAAAISVKSFLDKDAIYDSLDNLASIPQIDQEVLSFKFGGAESFSTFIGDHPSLFVFAYDGVSVETCAGHMASYFTDHPDIPKNRIPLCVIVNKKYFIKYEKHHSVSKQGVAIKPYTLVKQALVRDTQGYPFVQILHPLSLYTDWLPIMRVQTERYFQLAYGFTTKGSQ